jgi:hypothetical protein
VKISSRLSLTTSGSPRLEVALHLRGDDLGGEALERRTVLQDVAERFLNAADPFRARPGAPEPLFQDLRAARRAGLIDQVVEASRAARALEDLEVLEGLGVHGDFVGGRAGRCARTSDLGERRDRDERDR